MGRIRIVSALTGVQITSNTQKSGLIEEQRKKWLEVTPVVKRKARIQSLLLVNGVLVPFEYMALLTRRIRELLIARGIEAHARRIVLKMTYVKQRVHPPIYVKSALPCIHCVNLIYSTKKRI